MTWRVSINTDFLVSNSPQNFTDPLGLAQMTVDPYLGMESSFAGSCTFTCVGIGVPGAIASAPPSDGSRTYYGGDSYDGPTLLAAGPGFTGRIGPASQGGPAKTWDSVTDQRILTLHPKVQVPAADFINDMDSTFGIKLRVTQAYRTNADQDALYEQGRTTPGKVVTNAKGGESYHNYGLALDVVEIRGGKLIWNTNWRRTSQSGASHGFAWGGNWATPDRPHFQMTFGLSIKQLQQGKRP